MDPNLIIAVLVIAIVVLVAFILMQRNRSDKLRTRFGPEYERTVKESGGKGKAEAQLVEREQRVKSLAIRPLEPADRERFTDSWTSVQSDFVDDPARSIGKADSLLADVMSARGYPVTDFDQMSADISVDHPSVVQNYRAAHDIALRQERGEANTEDLRQGMIHYRALFEDLVSDPPATGDASNKRKVQ